MLKPNLFIAGAPKCGTSSMYYYLGAHPDVFMSERKEPRFFGADLELREGFCIRDELEYLELFRGGEGKRYRGEASVFYLYSQSAASEIRSYDPNAKIILQLRDPIDMIVSWHHHSVATGNEDLRDLAVAIDAEADRREGRRLPRDVWYPAGLQYTALVDYAPHVERFFDAFGRDRVHVLLFDDLAADAASSYRAVLEYLEVDTAFQPDFERKNPAAPLWLRPLHRVWIRNRRLREWTSRWIGPSQRREALYRLQKLSLDSPKLADSVDSADSTEATGSRVRAAALDPERRRQLQAQLAPCIDRLAELLARDLSHWASDTARERSDRKP